LVESPCPWVVIPRHVVVQPGFRIVILTRKAQIENKVTKTGGILIRQTIAEGFGLPAPYYTVVIRPGNLSRHTQMVGVDVVDVGCGACCRCRFQYGYRQVAQPDDFLDQLTCGVVFAGQVALFVVKVLVGVSCVGFAYALAEGVVAVAGGLPCCGVGGCDAPSCGVVAARKRGQVTLLVTKSNLTPLWYGMADQ